MKSSYFMMTNFKELHTSQIHLFFFISTYTNISFFVRWLMQIFLLIASIKKRQFFNFMHWQNTSVFKSLDICVRWLNQLYGSTYNDSKIMRFKTGKCSLLWYIFYLRNTAYKLKLIGEGYLLFWDLICFEYLYTNLKSNSCLPAFF